MLSYRRPLKAFGHYLFQSSNDGTPVLECLPIFIPVRRCDTWARAAVSHSPPTRTFSRDGACYFYQSPPKAGRFQSETHRERDPFAALSRIRYIAAALRSDSPEALENLNGCASKSASYPLSYPADRPDLLKPENKFRPCPEQSPNRAEQI